MTERGELHTRQLPAEADVPTPFVGHRRSYRARHSAPFTSPPPFFQESLVHEKSATATRERDSVRVAPPVEFGIVGFCLCLGEHQDLRQVAGSYVHDPERVLRWGYDGFHRAPT